MYNSTTARSIVIVVLVQRDNEEFGYWAGGDVEQEIKLRLENSALTNSFEVAHVRYVRSETTETPSKMLSNRDGGEMAWV